MIPLLLAAGLVIGGIAIVANWKSIVDWLKDFIPKLRETWKQVREYVPFGERIVGDIVVKGLDKLVQIMHKLYYKEDNHWVEETTKREVGEEQVPAVIRKKIESQRGETDITPEMEEELQLEV